MKAPGHPSENEPPQTLEHRAQQLYQRATQRIDPQTLNQLHASRREALRAAETPPSRLASWLIPTGAFAVIALAAMTMWQPGPHNEATPSAITYASSATDLDSELPPDADQTDPNLYQNLDFYDWLAANDSKPAMR